MATTSRSATTRAKRGTAQTVISGSKSLIDSLLAIVGAESKEDMPEEGSIKILLSWEDAQTIRSFPRAKVTPSDEEKALGRLSDIDQRAIEALEKAQAIATRALERRNAIAKEIAKVRAEKGGKTALSVKVEFLSTVLA